jgi:hypothetical protein
MTKPIARDPIYRRRRFEGEVIELCVRWYISYRLSYRDLAAMMAEGVRRFVARCEGWAGVHLVSFLAFEGRCCPQ